MVEIDGKEDLQRACVTSVADGMVVQTTTQKVDEHRRDRLMFLLSKHPHACLTCAQKEGCARFPCSTNVPENERCCPQFGKCEFQKIAEYVKIKPETSRYYFENLPFIKDDPLFERNYNLCIGCTRCIRACKEVRGIGAVDFVFDEDGRVILGTVSPNLRESACRFCTACVEVCPTGTLMDKKPFEETPCRNACPVGVDVPRYVHLAAQGKFDESYAVVKEKLPLPSVCGYVCLSF
ncbi:MAG: 4Fe-4S dicluster domain-containing protein [Deltaproteobacteria bacterium]|nr:4Fe-4S dicluster domain-containing protein [Deltaproteobacteria bacterium]